jgi:maltooligosyltrehalose trehalohydrolase
VHAVLTGERGGYYADFGSVGHVVESLRNGFVLSGRHSKYRRRRYGNSGASIPSSQLVIFTQNHDQTGNRMLGERLTALVSFEALKLAAGAVCLSPYLPLLFMGEEYGEPAPFMYFVDHSDRDLIEAVRRGRKEDFKSFNWQGDVPDPQSEATFLASRLNHDLREQGHHRVLAALYAELLKQRREHPALQVPEKESLELGGPPRSSAFWMRRGRPAHPALVLFNFGDAPESIPVPPGNWSLRLDSGDRKWNGPGSMLPGAISGGGAALMTPLSFALFTGEPGPS